MDIQIFDLGREFAANISAPAITEQGNGAYVRHDDHEALMQEKDAEIAALERTAVDQSVTIMEARAEVVRLSATLQFYADGDHFIRHDDSAWDTVSGEPQNFYEDESSTATVEDGTFARDALTQQAQT